MKHFTRFLLCFGVILLSAHFLAFSQSYRADISKSFLIIKAYKKGVLSGVAHNHVVVPSVFEANLQWNAEDVTQSKVSVILPVADFVVDRPEHRHQAGAEFESDLSEGDIKDIREAMLNDLLEADKYPQIEIHSSKVEGELPHLRVTLEIALHGVRKLVEVPVLVKKDETHLEVSGKFRVLQTDFNITPISLFFGAIQVKDELEIEFKMIATPSGIR